MTETGVPLSIPEIGLVHNVLKMIKLSKHASRRRFSEEFKKARVKDYERGEVTVREISRNYHVSVVSVYKWLKKYSYFHRNKILVVEEKESSTYKMDEAQKRIKDLEQILGQKQIKIEYLEELIEIASKEMDIDLKKTLGTQL